MLEKVCKIKLNGYFCIVNGSEIFKESAKRREQHRDRMSDKMEKITSIFSESQIEAIKLIIKKGGWGDCDQEFSDKKTYYAYGYCTNMDKGKEWSGKLSGISKAIKASGTNLIIMCSDWWGDGSGDMMFFNLELIDRKELEDWAN